MPSVSSGLRYEKASALEIANQLRSANPVADRPIGNTGIPMTCDDRQAPGRGSDIGPDMQASFEVDDGYLTCMKGGLQWDPGRFRDGQDAPSATCGQHCRKGDQEPSRQQLHSASRSVWLKESPLSQDTAVQSMATTITSQTTTLLSRAGLSHVTCSSAGRDGTPKRFICFIWIISSISFHVLS